MSSPRETERFDLERDLPTTDEDTAALGRLRSTPHGLDAWTQVQILSDSLPPAASRPRTRTFAGCEPFEL